MNKSIKKGYEFPRQNLYEITSTIFNIQIRYYLIQMKSENFNQ